MNPAKERLAIGRWMLAAFCLNLGLAFGETTAVKATWAHYKYAGPDYRRYDCATAEQALGDLLSMISARHVHRNCSWDRGLSADWEALAPIKEDKIKGRVEAFLKTEEGGRQRWLSGLGERWQSLDTGGKGEEPIDSVWLAAASQRFIPDVWVCNIYSQIFDYLLDTLPVRNVSQTFFCNPGSSSISVSFEYLEKAKPDAPRPEHLACH